MASSRSRPNFLSLRTHLTRQVAASRPNETCQPAALRAPPELLSQICSHLSHHPGLTTLRSVCRLWGDVATEHLFREIELLSHSAAVSFDETLRGPNGRSLALLVKVLRLPLACCVPRWDHGRPPITMKLQSIGLGFHPEHRRCAPTYRMFDRIARACTQVTELSAPMHGSFSSVGHLDVGCLRRLKKLTLSSVDSVRIGDLFPQGVVFAELEEVVLIGYQFIPFEWDDQHSGSQRTRVHKHHHDYHQEARHGATSRSGDVLAGSVAGDGRRSNTEDQISTQMPTTARSQTEALSQCSSFPVLRSLRLSLCLIEPAELAFLLVLVGGTLKTFELQSTTPALSEDALSLVDVLKASDVAQRLERVSLTGYNRCSIRRLIRRFQEKKEGEGMLYRFPMLREFEHGDNLYSPDAEANYDDTLPSGHFWAPGNASSISLVTALNPWFIAHRIDAWLRTETKLFPNVRELRVRTEFCATPEEVQTWQILAFCLHERCHSYNIQLQLDLVNVMKPLADTPIYYSWPHRGPLHRVGASLSSATTGVVRKIMPRK